VGWVTNADFLSTRNSQRGCATSANTRSDILWETSESGPHSYSGTAWIDEGSSYYGTGLSGGKGGCGAFSAALIAGGYGTTQQLTSCLYDGSSYAGGPSLPQNMRYTWGCGTPSSGFWVFSMDDTTSSSNEAYFNGTTWSSKSAFYSGPHDRGVVIGTYDAALAAAGATGYTTPTHDDLSRTWNGTSWTSITNYPTVNRNQSGFGTQGAAYVVAGEVTSTVTNAVYQWNGTSWAGEDNLPDSRDNHGGTGTGAGGWVIQGYTQANSPANPTYEWTFSRPVTCTSATVTLTGAGLVLQQPGRAHIISVVPDSFSDGQTGIVINTRFITTTGATVYIAGVEQTVTGTTADSITFTADKGTNEDGNYTLVVIEGP